MEPLGVVELLPSPLSSLPPLLLSIETVDVLLAGGGGLA